MEDGRSRCPFNPEYKSTAIIVGTLKALGAEKDMGVLFILFFFRGLEPLSTVLSCCRS